ncbi:dephospho-CoA kinase [Granulosicoccus sp. 3-233]|uniref:dephospho-CoA kinase n=1 Tax=Granulosicoccus sp. 3-233 TaxID=3417969 RepID=UPI003D3272FE
MQLVGLTGGIASGKSLVSSTFEQLGIPVIDADLLAREVVEPGSRGLQALAAHFGPDILTSGGELNRAVLRSLVFADESERKFLDDTLHPLIRQLSDQRVTALSQEAHPYIIFAVPLLLETGQQDRFDRIVVVDVPESVQMARLLARDGSSEKEARAILASQATREDRLSIADDVINNAGSIDDTRKQVSALHEKYIAADLHPD